ncbi:MAG: hypothetical protein KI785_03780 [Devosiaceae bacterium]|nr:hypothetical protein [Devosiaceae bacterium MH13]
MQAFVESGRFADLVIVLVLLEVLALWLVPRLVPSLRSAAPFLRQVWPSLVSGLCLVVALRFALTGAGWQPITLAMLAAFVIHIIDLARRWSAR